MYINIYFHLLNSTETIQMQGKCIIIVISLLIYSESGENGNNQLLIENVRDDDYDNDNKDSDEEDVNNNDLVEYSIFIFIFIYIYHCIALLVVHQYL